MGKQDLEMARRVACAVREAGGKAYFVGGFVRDRCMGRESKDIDLEVHGLPPEKLAELLDALGERLTIGASFGIFSLRHYTLDIALPRSEKATGRGHRDFAVFVDPFLGEKKAAARRDFTINAMLEDVLTGEVLDFFGGREDLRRGILRHVSGESFPEDPLRVFRAAQFAARFGFAVAEETRALCAGMETGALAGERVMGELEKALLEAEKPSRFFAELRAMGQLSPWFAEVAALIGVPQNPAYHPEGDAFTHTLQVLDEAAAMRGEAREPLWFLLAALCHDLGKAVTTDAALHAYGHEMAGLPLARRLLGRLTREAKLRDYVLNLTEHHMKPNQIAAQAKHEKSFLRLYDRALCPEDLLLLAKADHLGRVGPGTDRAALEESYQPTERRLREMLALYRARLNSPGVTGRDLIAAGEKPGPQFTEALARARTLQLAGHGQEEQLRAALNFLRAAQKKEEGNA
ncbi:MAG: CCA tRNA nucleotidyltransferase [bacterium]